MNSDMSQQVYQMLGDRYQPAIEYATLRNYAQQFANQLQQNPYYYYIMQARQNPMQFFNSTEIGNRLLTGDIHPTSSSLGASL